MHGEPAKRAGVGGIGVEGSPEGGEQTFEVIVTLLTQAARVAKALVEAFGSCEVEAEGAEAGALRRLYRQVGDEDEIARVEVDVLVVEAELIPELGAFGRRQRARRPVGQLLRALQHAPRVEVHLLLAL